MSDVLETPAPLARVPADAAVMDRLFREARTRNAWSSDPIAPETWRSLYDLVKFGPTAANSSPARFVFVTSEEGKALLGPLLSPGNQKALAAPCIAILGYDMDFPEQMPKLFPHNPGAKDWFADPVAREASAFRNSSMQGGYFIMAARALGLDTGAMSGFDAPGVDAAFWAGTAVKTNFLCALGHANDTPFPRSPRLDFDEACRFA